MAHIGAKNYNRYSDTLAHKRRNRTILKIVSGVLGGMSFIGLAGYLVFYTPFLKITEMTFLGLNTVKESELRSVVDSLSKKQGSGIFAFITELKNDNIAFFNSDDIENEIVSRFPIIKEVEIQKEYFNKVVINFIERTPLGVWCFGDVGLAEVEGADISPVNISCRYFDEDRKLWGNALKSTGSLILAVNDYRIADNEAIDTEIFDKIMAVASGLDEMGLKVVKVDIPQDYVGYFRAFTSKGYYLIFNVKTEIHDALRVLKIFLDEKGPEFTAEYIDLRIEGRVYFK